jgi:hypothetical protein
MMITDEAGRQLAVTDLNGAELRALRVLGSAGMIPSPDEPAAAGGQNPVTSEKGSAGGQGVLVERDFTSPPRRATLKQPRQKTPATPAARPTTKAS